MLFLKYSLGVRPHSSNYLNAVVVEKPCLFYLSGNFHVIFSFLDKGRFPERFVQIILAS